MAKDTIVTDWQRGMSYDDLHKKYGPWGWPDADGDGCCECDDCEAGRERLRREEEE